MKYRYWSLGMGCRGMFYGILFSAIIVGIVIAIILIVNALQRKGYIVTVRDSYHQTDGIEELRRAVGIYKEALNVMGHQREELKIELEVSRKRGSIWFNNYHCTRHALICTRLRLRDAEAMIASLLNGSGTKPPDIGFSSNDLDIV